jgi:hypothetical protein
VETTAGLCAPRSLRRKNLRPVYFTRLQYIVELAMVMTVITMVLRNAPV